MAGQDWFDKDFYAVLGVPSDAGASDIKRAYRKLARTHHPDANAGDPSADKTFQAIGEAYAVLSDAEQRRQYDAIRAMARGGARFTAGGGPTAGGAGFEDVLGNLFGQAGAGAGGPGGARMRFGGQPGAAGSPIFEDLFNGMFQPGDAGYGQYRSTRSPGKGADIAARVRLTFAQSLEGALLNVPLEGGRTVRAKVPAGMRDGQKVRVPGKGRPSEFGGEPGDLVVSLTVEPHPLFRLDGADVRLTLPITFGEATLGCALEVPTPDEGSVRLKVPAGTPSGRVLRVKGRGARTAKRTGDLLVTVQIAVPQRLDAAAREALERFVEATRDDDPRAGLLATAAEREQDSSGAGDDG